MGEGSSTQEIGYTSTEIIGEQALRALNDLEVKIKEEEKNEDFKSRHPLSGAIFNLHFVDSVIQPVVAELFTKRGIKKVDLNTWRAFSVARLSYLQNIDGAENGVNFTSSLSFQEIKKTMPEVLQKYWDMRVNRGVISNFGKQKRTDLIHKFQKVVKKSIR